MPRPELPVWFITGCSSGFGRAIAKAVLEHGWRAVVTARDTQKIEDLVAGAEGRGLALKLDVMDLKQVAAAIENAEATFGKIDVLVNNAGYGYLATAEEGEDSEIRAMFETNFFGLVRITQAVLPGMRRRRRGHIINISSIGGLVGFPASGYYAATKFAVEGLSEALAKEVELLGIKVLIVEPGRFRTDWAGRSLKLTPNAIEDYAKAARKRQEAISRGSGKQPGDPVRAAKAIIEAVQSSNPPLHLVLGREALELARGKLELLRRDFDAWEETSAGADFPAAQGEQ